VVRDHSSDAQFAGSWDAVSGHQAALYSSAPGGVSVDNAGRYYASKGVAPSKLVIGEAVALMRDTAHGRDAAVRPRFCQHGRYWASVQRYVAATPCDALPDIQA